MIFHRTVLFSLLVTATSQTSRNQKDQVGIMYLNMLTLFFP